jgi:uncharacterized membrane protein YjjP (DUF1212 family)
MQTSSNDKITFLMLIGSSLHRYGASTDRIEKALTLIAMKVDIDSQYLAFPTGILASFKEDAGEQTRMNRLEPGKINLSKLYYIDQVVDQVLFNRISLQEGTKNIEKVIFDKPLYNNALITLSYGLIGFAIAIFLKGSFVDASLSALLGLAVGLFTETVKEERIDSVVEGIASFGVSLATLYIGTLVPINTNIVILSALIILLPGLMLTLAIGELASQNLVAGTARLMGSFVILMKISFGLYIAYQIGRYLGFNPIESSHSAPNQIATILSLAIAGIGFSLSFQARTQEFFWIVLASFISYFSSHIFIEMFGATAGYLCAGTLIGSLSNIYSRIKKRPSLIVLLPAIILLVPGSVGFKALNLLFDQNVMEGFNSIFTMTSIGISLVTGTYFGAILVKPRRSL